jgi:hypothetical protein
MRGGAPDWQRGEWGEGPQKLLVKHTLDRVLGILLVNDENINEKLYIKGEIKIL